MLLVDKAIWNMPPFALRLLCIPNLVHCQQVCRSVLPLLSEMPRTRRSRTAAIKILLRPLMDGRRPLPKKRVHQHGRLGQFVSRKGIAVAEALAKGFRDDT